VGAYDQSRPTGALWENARAVMGGLSQRLNPCVLISRETTKQRNCAQPGWSIQGTDNETPIAFTRYPSCRTPENPG
jgi:hypothetical protein